MKLIIEKYLDGLATEPEMQELLEWLRKKENRFTFHSFRLEWKNRMVKTGFPAESRESWYRLQEQLAQKSFTITQKSNRLQFIISVAAIFFLIVSLGFSAYFFIKPEVQIPVTYSSVMAEKGQISKVELPDGSLVWLNSGSKIKYNNHFANDNRNVELTGEAYFKATKNTKLPMVINCGDLSVKVVGTQFNVNAYPENGNIDVVLEEGSVQLLNKKVQSFSYNLKPGERARYNPEDRELAISNVNPARFTSWKEGIINIYNQPLGDVAERLAMRYNQKFSVDPKIKDIRYTFTIKNEPLGEILLLMERITPVKAVQEKDVITFKPDMKKMRKAGG